MKSKIDYNLIKTDELINTDELIKVIVNALNYIDSRLINHGERVAYIAYELWKYKGVSEKIDLKVLLILSIFHDVGAFKTDEITEMLEYDSDETTNHCVYGYLFFKYLSPLHEYAEVILHHHTSYDIVQTLNINHSLYADIIYLADRIDVLIHRGETDQLIEKLTEDSNRFNPELVSFFANQKVQTTIEENLKSNNYHLINKKLIDSITFSKEETFGYLEMMIYSVDFRSEQTVTHTINIVAITFALANFLNIPPEDYSKLYLGALLHDIGKIAIPLSILESPNKLSDDEMHIMKTHVEYTEKIIRGIISDEISNIAARHHEKLDGSGYPYGITGSNLTFYEQLIAVADIISALISKRSYKEEFSKETVIKILSDLAQTNKLNAEICNIAIIHFDDILKDANKQSEHIIKKYTRAYNEYLAFDFSALSY